MNRLTKWLFGDRGAGVRDEAELRERLVEERTRFMERQRRVERVMADFRRAEAVVSDHRGSR